ncbi:hypothetical protein GCM10009672_23160 [Nesterenkonia lutea]
MINKDAVYLSCLYSAKHCLVLRATTTAVGTDIVVNEHGGYIPTKPGGESPAVLPLALDTETLPCRIS